MRTHSSLIALAALLLAGLSLQAQPAQPKDPKDPKDDSRNPKVITEVLGRKLADWAKAAKSDPDPGVRLRAVQALVVFGEAGRKESGPALLDALKDADASVRVNAAIALTQLGVDPKDEREAIDIMTQRLGLDTQAQVRLHLCNALARFGTDARGAVPNLIKAAKDTVSHEIRKAAIYALGGAAYGTKGMPADRNAIHQLIAMFAGLPGLPPPDRSAEVRFEAVIALADIGVVNDPQDRKLMNQAFHQALNDKEKAVHVWARVGLITHGDVDVKGQPNDKAHLDEIVKMLMPKEEYLVRMQAVRALGVLGKAARPHIPALIVALDDPEPAFVMLVVYSLSEHGTNADEAIKPLEKMMADKKTTDQVKAAIKAALPKLRGEKVEKAEK